MLLEVKVEILTEELAERAIDLTIPVIEMVNQISERGYDKPQGHIIICRPRTYMDQAWKDLVLAKRSFGNRENWGKAFDLIAYSKAERTWFWGEPTSVVQTMPQLLFDGDTLFFGSAIVGKIPTAYSGYEPEFDEVIAGAAGYWCQALCKLKAKKMLESGKSFVE
jgi:hypothetical protein